MEIEIMIKFLRNLPMSNFKKYFLNYFLFPSTHALTDFHCSSIRYRINNAYFTYIKIAKLDCILTF